MLLCVRFFPRCILLSIWLIAGVHTLAQMTPQERQVLEYQLSRATNDTMRADALSRLSSAYWGENQAKAIQYAQQALNLGLRINHKDIIARAYNSLGVIHGFAGSYEIATGFFFKALALRETIGDSAGVASSLSNIGILYLRQKKYRESLRYEKRAEKLQMKGENYSNLCITKGNIADIYNRMNMPDSALSYLAEIEILEKLLHTPFYAKYHLKGNAYTLKKQYEKALVNYDSIEMYIDEIFTADKFIFLAGKSHLYSAIGEHQKAILYGKRLVDETKKSNSLYEITNANQVMSSVLREASRFKEALLYLDIARQLEDSLHIQDAARQLESLQIQYEVAAKQRDNDRLQRENEWKNRALLAGLLVLAILVALLILLYFINQKRNEALQKISEINRSLEDAVARRTEELTRRNEQLIGYAYLNSHEVRGPLARLMGLVYLLKQGWWNRDKEELIDLIDVSASELDKVIRDINQHLNEAEGQHSADQSTK